MELLGFSASQVHPLASLTEAGNFLGSNAASLFVWADFSTEEVTAAPDVWRESVRQLAGAPILDLHLADATNAAHPSYFDTTNAYDMVIFRKLTFETSRAIAEAEPQDPVAGTAKPSAAESAARQKRYPPGFLPALAKIDTQPVTFFVFDTVLVTVRSGQSRTVDQVRQRLIELCQAPRPQATPVRGNGQPLLHGVRPPSRPEDLMLRLLNAMVDRYLELRAPLTRQLDRWQRALLNSRRSFSSWEGLLDARIQLRKLEHLSEEQRDALQEFRDSLLDNRFSSDQPGGPANAPGRDEVLLVRINDVMEHIQRVLAHARRLEDSIESAVQIHFSAVAHRTNRTMRALTLITALFMPLTLITGVFGMNFDRMPWLREPHGFWWSIGLMGAVALGLAALWALGRRLER
ncbi:Mg2+ and Co2+ transporter CorA [Cupriavidus necator]|uniref:Magnesium transporter n=1 Tax=Cupriavidus necator (strain ATCC 17699 / DSM 428 / KCTC 22496 / NCIMB 10442 / H16 / Stanier 337) TaxID=381666 RepID=Q0K649_CUPNH|nr:magnesium transporter CorA family protein [Cupriavidus necator]QCC02272.1 magnesium transporter [Cupriavidus necator H16]QQB78323.1 magnesium transporter CorA family protein [Cupriavidus necator]WKA40677.1 magnesium transporter CorA family protein [Cupriavidus necator]CAJ94522.1 Putative Mg2+ and Co2+ transporter [Cupriavidus necator H16]